MTVSNEGTKPDVMTMDAYRARFSDVAHWTPHVRRACAQWGIVVSCIAATVPGTYPVFLVNDELIVKLFGELFAGVRTHEVERQCYALLAQQQLVQAPKLVGHGTLFPDDAAWRWPFLISTRLPGEPLNAVRGTLPRLAELRLAGTLGRAVRQVHDLPLPVDGPLEGGWGPFLRWLAGQRAACKSQQATWGSLPASMMAEIQEYLLPLDALVDTNRPPRLLHADLTGDHLMLVRDSNWELGGLIDWGDARVGDPLYELVALHLDAFACDKALLAAFCRSYGLSEALRPEFPRRMMSYMLLHEFDAVGGALRSPWARSLRHLDELAQALWAIGP